MGVDVWWGWMCGGGGSEVRVPTNLRNQWVYFSSASGGGKRLLKVGSSGIVEGSICCSGEEQSIRIEHRRLWTNTGDCVGISQWYARETTLLRAIWCGLSPCALKIVHCHWSFLQHSWFRHLCVDGILLGFKNTVKHFWHDTDRMNPIIAGIGRGETRWGID